MIGKWLNYFWQIIVSFFQTIPFIKGKPDKADISASPALPISKPDSIYPVNMSDMQIANQDKSGALVSANREEEVETVEETTLSESHQDLGHTQISEKGAEFDSTIKKSIIEDHKTHKSESNKNVKQSESVEISENKQVMKSSWETSQSYSMEETEEYEIEG